MAGSELPTAEVKVQASPSVQPSHVVTMIPISDSTPLSVPLRILSAQQMALVLQQGRQKIVAMYDEKNRLGEEIASAQRKIGTLDLEISLEIEQSITLMKKVKALTEEKHLLEQEIISFKKRVQLFHTVQEKVRQYMQDLRLATMTIEKLFFNFEALKDEKHKIEQEMPGLKALQDKLSRKTLVATAEYNQIEKKIAEAKADHDKVAQENLQVLQDVKYANTKKSRVEQEIQVVEKEKGRLLQDILAIRTAITTNPSVAASNKSTDQKAKSDTIIGLKKTGWTFWKTPMMILFGFMVLFCLFVVRYLS